MKPKSLILAFLPLVVFSILARLLHHSAIGIAGVVAAAAALVSIVLSRPIWPPKILNLCSLVVFAVFGVLGFTLGNNDDRWLSSWGGAGVAVILGVIILALVPLMPFTEQFARDSVPKSEWSSPTFKKINRVLSTAWGLAIVAIGASRVAAVAVNGASTRRLPEILLGIVVPVAIIVYMFKFSKSYPERVVGPSANRAGGPQAA